NKNEGKRTAKVDWTTGPVTGEVMVTVTDANGCQGNTMLSIEVLAPLQPVITGTFEYCRGREATLDVGTYALAPQTYLWSNGETVQSFSTTSIGVYTVTVTNQEGCTGTATAEVSATPCLAEAGVLTTNAVTICAGGNIEVSTTSQQTGANYLQYFFIYTQDNLNNTSLHEYAIADYGNGEASASFGDLAAGDYLVCAYNECQDCLPNPSPITTSLDDIDQIGTIQDGCFDFQCANITVPEAFAPDMNGTGLITENNAAGQNIYIAEVCGGTAPYTIDFESSAGLFAAVNDYPSPIAGCIKYQILYVPEADWTLTVTDDNDCQNETVVFTNEGTSSTTPVLQIVGHTAEVETCVGDADGSISVEVEGGDSTCGEYSYSWSGPNGFSISAIGSTTGNTATGLASGKYDVTVTDCTGTTTVREGMNVARKTRGRSRSRGGCKTTGNNFLQGFEANENIMLGVYPNPFADKTSIEFTLSETSKIWLSVYAMDGREVKELLKGETRESAVLNRVNLEAEGLQNGLYILQLETESGERLHTKLLISK
ncbi:MAG: T9SS type A sorting domain-containing protein, partial [Chitinophagales bacterium]